MEQTKAITDKLELEFKTQTDILHEDLVDFNRNIIDQFSKTTNLLSNIEETSINNAKAIIQMIEEAGKALVKVQEPIIVATKHIDEILTRADKVGYNVNIKDQPINVVVDNIPSSIAISNTVKVEEQRPVTNVTIDNNELAVREVNPISSVGIDGTVEVDIASSVPLAVEVANIVTVEEKYPVTSVAIDRYHVEAQEELCFLLSTCRAPAARPGEDQNEDEVPPDKGEGGGINEDGEPDKPGHEDNGFPDDYNVDGDQGGLPSTDPGTTDGGNGTGGSGSGGGGTGIVPPGGTGSGGTGGANGGDPGGEPEHNGNNEPKPGDETLEEKPEEDNREDDQDQECCDRIITRLNGALTRLDNLIVNCSRTATNTYQCYNRLGIIQTKVNTIDENVAILKTNSHDIKQNTENIKNNTTNIYTRMQEIIDKQIDYSDVLDSMDGNIYKIKEDNIKNKDNIQFITNTLSAAWQPEARAIRTTPLLRDWDGVYHNLICGNDGVLENHLIKIEEPYHTMLYNIRDYLMHIDTTTKLMETVLDNIDDTTQENLIYLDYLRLAFNNNGNCFNMLMRAQDIYGSNMPVRMDNGLLNVRGFMDYDNQYVDAGLSIYLQIKDQADAIINALNNISVNFPDFLNCRVFAKNYDVWLPVNCNHNVSNNLNTLYSTLIQPDISYPDRMQTINSVELHGDIFLGTHNKLDFP